MESHTRHRNELRIAAQKVNRINHLSCIKKALYR